jgi:hypothetical protein
MTSLTGNNLCSIVSSGKTLLRLSCSTEFALNAPWSKEGRGTGEQSAGKSRMLANGELRGGGFVGA